MRGFPSELEDRYTCLGLLGRGGMGAVFQARDRELGREVAVKVLAMRPTDEVLVRMEREARTMGRISHPGVIEVYDYGLFEGRPYLVMEYLDGKSLKDLPEGSDPLPIMLQAARALEAVHAQGVLHRDVKPENIMRTAEGRTVLTDFGLAYDPGEDPLTRTGAVVGTVAFMSPEVLAGGRGDRAADWWAWGASLFQLEEGRIPFELATLMRMNVPGQAFPQPEFRRLEDPQRRELIRRCLHRDPGRRPQGVAAIEGILEGGGSGEFGGDTVAVSRLSGSDLGASSVSGADGAASESSRPFRTGFLLGLVALGLGLGMSLGEGKGPALPPDPTPAPAPKSPFGLDYARALREEFDRVGWLYRGPGGRVESFRGRTPPEDWREVLSQDPAEWGPLLASLPELERFRSWLSTGGRAEDLTPDLVEDLREVDESYRGQGLPRPFFPCLYLEPRRDPLVVPAEIWEGLRESEGGPEQVEGWAATAIEHLLRAVRRSQAMQEVARQLGQDGIVPPPELPADYARGLRLLTFRAPALFQGDLWHQEAARRRSGAWSRELGEETHAFLYAARQALRSLPAQEAMALAVFFRSVHRRAVWSRFTYLARLDPTWVLGQDPETAGEWWLAARLLEQQLGTAGILGFPQAELLARTRESLDRFLELGPGAGASEAIVRTAARLRVILEYRHGSPDVLLQGYRRYRDVILGRGWTVELSNLVPVVTWAGMAREGEEDALTPVEIEELHAWYQSFPSYQDRPIFESSTHGWAAWLARRVGS